MIIRPSTFWNATKFAFFTALRRMTGKPLKVSEDRYWDRIDTCRKCPNLTAGQCKVSTCFVEIKALFAGEYCPDKPARWN